jgi:hypothetical protein
VKVINYISYVILALTLILIIAVGLLLYWPIDPFVVYSQPTMTKDVFYVGQPIEFNIDYCKNTDAGATVNYTLIDGVTYSLPPVDTNRPKGCYNGVVSAKALIPNIPSGTYYLSWKATYHINPLRNFVEEFQTKPFKIINLKD